MRNRVVTFVEVVPSVIKPEHVGVTDCEAENVIDHAHSKEPLVVNVVSDEAVPSIDVWGLHFLVMTFLNLH